MSRWPRVTREHIVVLVAGMAIGALLVGTSVAVTSKSFKYSKAKTGYLFLSPMEFGADALYGATADYFNVWWDVDLINNEADRCFNASVHVPQGAKIKSVNFYYTSDATSNFYGALVRQHISDGVAAPMVQVEPADDTNTRTSVSGSVLLAEQKVDNKQFAYGLGVCPFSGTVFHGARVKYTYTSAGD